MQDSPQGLLRFGGVFLGVWTCGVDSQGHAWLAGRSRLGGVRAARWLCVLHKWTGVHSRRSRRRPPRRRPRLQASTLRPKGESPLHWLIGDSPFGRWAAAAICLAASLSRLPSKNPPPHTHTHTPEATHPHPPTHPRPLHACACAPCLQRTARAATTPSTPPWAPRWRTARPSRSCWRRPSRARA